MFLKKKSQEIEWKLEWTIVKRILYLISSESKHKII